MHLSTQRRFNTPRKRTILGAALAAVAALALGGTALAEVFDEYSGPYQGTTRHYYAITAKHSGLNLNVGGASTANGAEVAQWKHVGAMNEQWEKIAFDGKTNSSMFRNRWSRQCLTPASGAEGALVVQRPCVNSLDQRWAYGYYTDHWEFMVGPYRNLATGFDLNIAGGSGLMGAKLIQYRHAAGAPNAMFRLTAHQEVVD